MSCFVKRHTFKLLDRSMIAVEKLTLPDLPPVLRQLQQAECHANQAVDTISFAGKLGRASDYYSYSEEEKRQLENDMRAKGLL